MSPSNHGEFDRNSNALDAEQTLRLIATLPAPQGLEDRVKARLHRAPQRAAVIAWPFWSSDGARWMHSAGMRAAAAAAIVLVVAGGGWEVYSHIHIAPAPSAVAAPPMLNGAGNFSSAGARRVPQTLELPVVSTPKPDGTKSTITSKKRDQTHAKTTAAPVQPAR